MLSEDLVHALILRSFSGDKAAYSELLTWLQEHCQGQLKMGLLTYHNFPRELKLDITQEVLWAFHQTHQTFDTSRSIYPWINALIRHKTIDFIRRKDFRVNMTGVDIEVVQNSWSTEDEDPIESQDVMKLLHTLPSKQAEIVRLSKIEGYSNKEIASDLKMTESNVKVSIFRALKVLKKIASEQRK